jgi:putative flippase GtrA
MDFIEKFFTLKFIKYVFWGAFNNAIAYAIYAGTLYLGGHYTLAAFSSWFLGILLTFFTMSKFVFESSDNSRIFVFYLVHIGIFLLNIAVLSVYDSLGFNLYIGGLVNMLFIPLVSFYLMNTLVFK